VFVSCHARTFTRTSGRRALTAIRFDSPNSTTSGVTRFSARARTFAAMMSQRRKPVTRVHVTEGGNA
jgi:hypothetical protein